MTVALLDQKGGVGKTSLALHLAGAWAHKGKRVVVIDADPQASALDRSEQRAREALPVLFVIGLARDTLHRGASEIARDADHVLIDGPPRVATVMRSALLAADLIIIPEQPSSFDSWTSREICGCSKKRVSSGFNPLHALRSTITPPAQSSSARRRKRWRPFGPLGSGRPACRLRDRAARRGDRADHAMKTNNQKHALAARAGDPGTWVRTPEPHPKNGAKPDRFAALTIGVTSRPRGRIKVAGFQRRITAADMFRDLLSGEFPDNSGGAG